MDKFTVVEGVAAPMPLINIDTDGSRTGIVTDNKISPLFQRLLLNHYMDLTPLIYLFPYIPKSILYFYFFTIPISQSPITKK